MKSVKKLALLSLFLVVAFSACKDSSNESLTEHNNFRKSDRVISIYNFNPTELQLTGKQAEMVRLLAEERSHHIALQATANWGGYSPTPDQSFTLMGRFPNGVAVTLPTGNYADNEGDGEEVVMDAAFKNLFGKDLSFGIAGGSGGKKEYSSYIPKLLKAEQISQPQSMGISRNMPNKLVWNSDSKNPLGVVLLQYHCRDNSQHPMAGKIVKHDVLVMDDDGEFDISPLISDGNIKSIQLNLIRGVAFPYGNEVLFSITTNDMHLYEVTD